MTSYRFVIGDVRGIHLSFEVTATSPQEAVRQANAALQEPTESESTYLGSPTHHAFFTLHEDVRVDESMVVEQRPTFAPLPRHAFYLLIEHNYDYGGEIEDLRHDEEPSFMKGLETEGSVYGFLRVTARNRFAAEGWSYTFEAVLYPLKHARMLDGQGGAHYRVTLEDGQAYITTDELPQMLEIYERKFAELIHALRKADPVDGLPLDEQDAM